MSREQHGIFGRDEAWEALDEAVLAPERLGTLLLLRGPAGAGKSALLSAATEQWRRRETRVAAVPAAAGGTVEQLLTTTRELLGEHPEPGLREALTRGASAGGLPLVHELTRALTRADRRTALVVDDIDRADPEAVPVLSLLLRGVQTAGGVAIAASRSRADDVAGVADRVFDLPALDSDDVAALAVRWSGRPAVDPKLVARVRADLGSLRGNPGAIVSALRALDEQDRLVDLDEHLCLRWPDEPIPLSDDHELLLALRHHGPGAERLATSIAVLGSPPVDDLPAVTEAAEVDLRSRGQMLDRLVADDVVRVCGNGRVRPAVPALGAALRRIEHPLAHDLPSTMARHLLEHAERGGAVDRRDLADRLVRADPAVTGGSLAVEVLVDEAYRARGTDPARATDWYRAALRRLARTDRRRPRLLLTTVRLQLRLGRHGEIADDVGAAVRERLADPGCGAVDLADPQPGMVIGGALIEISMMWLASLLHEERTAELEIAREFFDRLSPRSTSDSAARDLCAALLNGETGTAVSGLHELADRLSPSDRPPMLAEAVAEMLVLLAGLGGDDEEFSRAFARWRDWTPLPVPEPHELREAGSVFDRAGALEAVLGWRYGRQDRSPLITYQRIVRAYHAGDWDAALSLAREMRIGRRGEPDSPTLLLSQAHAAEICSARGQRERAAEWLRDVDDDIPAGHMIATARAGLSRRCGDPRRALDEGMAAYERHRDAGRLAGLERLLARLVWCANDLGDVRRARQVLGELEQLHERTRTRMCREHLLSVVGLVEGDHAPVAEAYRLARERGDAFNTMVCSSLAGRLSDDPQPWLHEAYELAVTLGLPAGRGGIDELMRELGVPQPRRRSSREALSETELRIVELVSDGYTNRQIAMAVRVSEKTVESHVTRLLARTGCRSRVELAAAHLAGTLTATPV
jgi:DNA-binding CsgD family transcriptional regulator